ncbi:MAG TPA: PspC domain-containing protein [Solirubrobacteraceae bacterium]|jgi:phage shock protein PspC (stress-responsive transcriptional regulator)|nr:PspC domain-containing protein [Solirubrobacteraceae bacterium]
MAAAQTATSTHPALRRYPDRGLLGGVCAGIAEHLGVPVLVARLLTAMLIAVGGIGVAVYAIAWALIPVAPESEGLGRAPGAWREAVVIVVGVAGVLLGLRFLGLGLAGAVIWPLVLGVCGMALVWRPTVDGAQHDATRRRLSPRERLRRSGKLDAPRLVVGGLLVAFASASLLHMLGVLHSLGAALGAVAIIAVMLSLLFGPWFMRMGRSLSFERAARIRGQERAELAAHLHDSVLQTLALIQKRAADPSVVAGLARRQERELRRWLLERPDPAAGESIAIALERAAAEVEELHQVPIEVVTVGDGPLDGGLEAMVQAAREAMTNAAKFAGSERIDLFAEVEPDRVEVYVRDRGVGFDALAIPTDRRGVRDSIVARMQRHHGSAAVHSTPGEGTEVELVMERGSAA